MFIDEQQVTFSMDGMAISAQMAQNIINSGWIGGSIGLTQILMKQSDAHFTNAPKIQPKTCQKLFRINKATMSKRSC